MWRGRDVAYQQRRNIGGWLSGGSVARGPLWRGAGTGVSTDIGENDG